MTEDKARKRAIRTRMDKTGERYTAARAQVLKLRDPGPLPPRVADPGMSEEKLKQATGCDWDQWLGHLDWWGARERTHTEIARHLREEMGVGGWWSQAITVGYERARGMRAKHQRSGGFAVGVSKTLPAAAGDLFPLVAEASGRRRWLAGGGVRLRTTQPGRTARFDGPEGSRVHVYLVPKGDARTTVTVEVEKLPDADSVERARTFWKERLARLAQAL